MVEETFVSAALPSTPSSPRARAPYFCVLWPEEGSAELPEGFPVGPFGRSKMSSETRLREALLFLLSLLVFLLPSDRRCPGHLRSCLPG